MAESLEYINYLRGVLAPDRLEKLISEMVLLHKNKNAGYSGDNPDTWANFRDSEEIGISAFMGCMIRLGDKRRRINNLLKNPDNNKVGESIKDTLADEAAYALIGICLYNELQNE